MDDLIKEKCDLYSIDPSVLTDNEIATLKKEIEAEKKGLMVLDSVLDNPEIRYRDLKK